MRKTLIASALVASLTMALPALAMTETVQQGGGGTTKTEAVARPLSASSTPSAEVSKKITCVGQAVATRETAIATAMTAYTSAVNTAYTARANALKQAYTASTLKEARTAVQAAWATFKTALKDARKAWQSARDTAWKAYRKTAVACGAPAGTGDGVNSESEMFGS